MSQNKINDRQQINNHASLVQRLSKIHTDEEIELGEAIMFLKPLWQKTKQISIYVWSK